MYTSAAKVIASLLMFCDIVYVTLSSSTDQDQRKCLWAFRSLQFTFTGFLYFENVGLAIGIAFLSALDLN